MDRGANVHADDNCALRWAARYGHLEVVEFLTRGRKGGNGNYYKILNNNECHRGLQYKTGLNIDPKPFKAYGNCESGGCIFLVKNI